MNVDRKVDGTLVLEKIDFNRVLTRRVQKNNKTSSKVTLPADLEGKEVYVIVPARNL